MRERLIELISKCELSMWGKIIHGGIQGEREYIADYLIDNDVVSVVRCKDCKYRGELDCPMYHEELEDCDDGDYVYTDIVATDNTVDDGFCYRGEREFE